MFQKKKNEVNRALAAKKYDTKRPPEKEMIFGVRAVIEAIAAGKVLDKVLVRREQFGSNAQPFYVQLDAYGHPIAEPMAFTTDPKEFINWLKY